MMAHVLEHRDIESHGLKLIVQKQGALLLKEVVNYTLFMTKTETPKRAVRVRALAGDIVLCSWARHFTPTVPLSTQVYKWVPANLMLGSNPAMY